MKYAGLGIMLLSHPLGYNLWKKIIWGPYIYPGNMAGYTETEETILISVGILQLFFIGLSLFLTGIISERKRREE